MTKHRAWPLYLPIITSFSIGAAGVLGAIVVVHGAGNSNDLEGALMLVGLGVLAMSLILPVVIFALAISALQTRPMPFRAFLAIIVVALAPVAYIQCVNPNAGLLLGVVGGNAFEALAVFYGATTLVAYAIYRLVPSAAAEQ